MIEENFGFLCIWYRFSVYNIELNNLKIKKVI